jgi:hypothetical protein
MAQAKPALVDAPQQSIQLRRASPKQQQTDTVVFPTWLTGLEGYRVSFPNIELTMNQPSVEYLTANLKVLPERFAQRGCNPFIHHKQYPDRLPPLLSRLLALCHINQTDSGSDAARQAVTQTSYLLLHSIPSVFDTFDDKLAFVQSLVLLQIITLFSPTMTPLHRQQAEARVPLLKSWILKLYESVPDTLPPSMDPYRAWLIAESCRRTMHVAYMILGVHSVLTQGTFTLDLFIEALPLDRNSLKWEYGDYNCERRRALTGEPVNCVTNLMSYRELADAWCKRQVKHTTLFEEMLLVACKGVEIVLPRLGTDVESEESRNYGAFAQEYVPQWVSEARDAWR